MFQCNNINIKHITLALLKKNRFMVTLMTCVSWENTNIFAQKHIIIHRLIKSHQHYRIHDTLWHHLRNEIVSSCFALPVDIYIWLYPNLLCSYLASWTIFRITCTSIIQCVVCYIWFNKTNIFIDVWNQVQTSMN